MSSCSRLRSGTFAKQEEFLAALFRLARFGRGTHFLNLGVARPARGIHVTWLDHHKALLAQRLQVFAHRRFHPRAIELVHDFTFYFGEGLFALVVMLQHLQNQESLFRFRHFRQLVFLHVENFVFELLGKFSALVHTQEAALRFRFAVGKPFGHLAKVFSVLDPLQRGFRFFLQVGNLFRLLPLRAHLNFPQRHLLLTHVFLFVRLVIFRDFLIADGDVRTDFAADHPLRQQRTANVVLEILPVEPLRGHRLFQLFHALDFILCANGIEPLDQYRLDAHSHVLCALHQQRLVDQLAQRSLLPVTDVRFQLFRGALALAILPCIFLGAIERLFIFRARDDLVVDARNYFFDGPARIRIHRFLHRGCGSFLGCFGRHSRLLQDRGRRLRLRLFRLLFLCRERQRGAQRRNDN